MQKSITKNSKETQKLGENFAGKVLTVKPAKNAVVLALRGNLGAGKTTFLQGFASGLGIEEKILSPTFVIMKKFAIPQPQFEYFYHIDCYRIENVEDAMSLGLEEIIKDSKNIVAIEWPERILAMLPKEAVVVQFTSLDQNIREIDMPLELWYKESNS